jgi:hypothetical protein
VMSVILYDAMLLQYNKKGTLILVYFCFFVPIYFSENVDLYYR